MTLRRTSLPEVAFRVVLPAGSGSPPVGLPGTASLVGRLLTEGAAGRSSREMADWIDGLGLEAAVSVGYDATTVRVYTLAELLADALEVLAALVAAPEFPPHEVERVRAERVDRLRRLRDEPDHVAEDVLAELLYGDSPYGRRPWGRPGSVRAIDRDRVLDFHRRRYAPPAASLVAVGDLPAGFAERVAEHFAEWSNPASDGGAPTAVDGPAASGTLLVDRPGSGQSVIRIGGIGLARGDRDEPAARVMNAVLGGIFNSRLNLNLREDKGWTYGARSALDLRRSPGPIVLRASVETGVTAAAVAEMRREIRRMIEEPPEADELRTAAGALTRSLPLRFETSSQLAGRLVESIVYGLPDDYWTVFPDRIGAVTPGEVRAAARRYLDPGHLVTLVVGDAAAVAADLEKLGPLEVRTVAPET